MHGGRNCGLVGSSAATTVRLPLEPCCRRIATDTATPVCPTAALADGDEAETEHLPRERYERAFGSLPNKGGQVGTVPYHYNWGVISMTQEFARNKSIPLHVTFLQDCCDSTPARTRGLH